MSLKVEESQRGADFDAFLLSLESVFRLPETLRPLRGQPLAVLIEIHQREAGTQASVILFESAVSHLIEAKDDGCIDDRAGGDADKKVKIGQQSCGSDKMRIIRSPAASPVSVSRPRKWFR